MGDDSFNLQQSIWIRKIILHVMFDKCYCEVYQSGISCTRCDRLQTAAELFPIQHRQAMNDFIEYERRTNGIQP